MGEEKENIIIRGIKGLFRFFWNILTCHIWVIGIVLLIVMWGIACLWASEMPDFVPLFKQVGKILAMVIFAPFVMILFFKIHSARVKSQIAHAQRGQADAQTKMAEAMLKQFEEGKKP